MDLPPFVTPHCHVSSLDSASTPKAFIEREKELGTGYITITDHGTLAGCQKVYEDGKKAKLTPIIGLEGYFRDDDDPILIAAGVPRDKDVLAPNGEFQAAGGFSNYFKYGHFTCHFRDQEAYRTACKLLSHAKVEKHGSELKPIFNWAMMEELGAANVTLGSGCLIGMVQRHLLDHDDPVLARKYYERMRSLVRPGNFFVEVFPHRCTHNWVAGVFLTLQSEGGSVPEKVRWYAGKTLKTNVGEIHADELAKAFKKEGCKHTHLLAVKNYRVWDERPPSRILAVEHVEDFIQNECRPYAPDGDVQLGANRFMVDLAEEYGDPILVSDDSHYAHAQEKVVQDVRLAQSGSWRFFGSYHRQSSAEAAEYFSKYMGVDGHRFTKWIENSHRWAEQFKSFKLQATAELPTKFYEPLYAGVGAKTSLEYTMNLIKQHGRMDWSNRGYVDRLHQEIQLLYQNGTIDLLPYWYVFEEVVDLYTKNGRLTGPGRGSAAGVLLSYLLGITHVDPLRYQLSLDRFITKDRIAGGKFPDIDQDLPDRDLLVGPDGKHGWLHDRFGDHMAPISTVMTLKLRSAVLDVARFTLGEVPRDIAELAHKFEKPPQGLEDVKHVLGYEDSGNWIKGSSTYDPPLMAYIKSYPEQWEIVKKCLGLGRALGRHACAVAIANYPLWERIPLTKISDVVCTQFTAAAVEAAGVLKDDFLVINSLNDIEQTIKLVQERNYRLMAAENYIDGKLVPGVRCLPDPKGDGIIDIWDLPPDQAVFSDVATGKTETVFQYNTPGAVQWMRHFGYKRPDSTYAIDSVESMAAFTALDRPGPLDAYVQTPDAERCTKCVGGKNSLGEPCTHGKHNMMVEYARRARGATPSPDILKIFDRLFPETHGIMVYQEQLQRLYQEVTGCSGPEAEEFRSNVAKKKKEKIIEAYPKFMAGAEVKLGSKEAAQQVWDFVNTWAAYGFNKSHAVCYAIIGYACAYLKHHYPLEWWTSVLSNAKKEEINEKFWRYAGHLIDLPDMTKAHHNFKIVGERIQAPLSLLHGVGEKAHEELLAGAPYSSVADLVDKIEARKAAGATKGKGTKKVKEKQDNGEVVTRVVEVDKVTKGRSALNSGIVYKLIVSGAMDKLFPADYTTLEMLAAYETAVFEQTQRERLAAGKKASKKAAPKPVKPEYINLNQYTRYQLRKSILPAYSEPVLPMLVQRAHATVFSTGHGNYYRWIRNVCFGDAGTLERINAAEALPESGVRVAVAAYVEDVRQFNYGARKEKEAVDLTVDIDGAHMKFVRWPDRETGELDEDTHAKIAAGLKGALVILVLSKFRENKPFSIDAIEVVQRPLGAAEDDPEPEESPAGVDPSAIPGVNSL